MCSAWHLHTNYSYSLLLLTGLGGSYALFQMGFFLKGFCRFLKMVSFHKGFSKEGFFLGKGAFPILLSMLCVLNVWSSMIWLSGIKYTH